MNSQNSYGKRHFERPTAEAVRFPLVRRLVTLVILVIISFLSGLIGALVALKNAATVIQVSPETDRVSDRAIRERTVGSVLNVIDSQTAFIVLHPATARAAGDNRVVEAEAIITRAVALTSDGWLVADARTIKNDSAYDVFIDGALYPVERLAIDDYTRSAFLKIANSGLRPASIDRQYPAAGEVVVAKGMRPLDDYFFTEAFIGESPLYTGLQRKGSSVPSGKLNALVEIIPLTGGDVRDGVVFFDERGVFIGVFHNDAGVRALVPAPQIRVAFEALLQGSGSSDLGITYTIAPFGSIQGVVAVAVRSVSRTTSHGLSPAYRSGLKTGDFIISVNGDSIGTATPFDLLWRKHASASNAVSLRIERDGSPSDLTVLLEGE